MVDVMRVFAEVDAQAEALQGDLKVLRGADGNARAELVARWRSNPTWLFDLDRAIAQATDGAEDPDGDTLAIWKTLFDEVLRAGPGEDLRPVASAAIGAATLAQRPEVAEDLATRAREAARAVFGQESEEAWRASLDLAEVRMNRSVFSEELLVEVLSATVSNRMRRRALEDLGVVRMVAGRYAQAFALWDEAHRLEVGRLGSVDLPFPPADRRLALVHGVRRCLNLFIPTQSLHAWGLGGPRMLVVLFALSDSLETARDPAARLVRAEAEARLQAGLAAWGVVDEETRTTTQEVADEIAQMLESDGHAALAAHVRGALAGARPR